MGDVTPPDRGDERSAENEVDKKGREGVPEKQ